MVLAAEFGSTDVLMLVAIVVLLLDARASSPWPRRRSTASARCKAQAIAEDKRTRVGPTRWLLLAGEPERFINPLLVTHHHPARPAQAFLTVAPGRAAVRRPVGHPARPSS